MLFKRNVNHAAYIGDGEKTVCVDGPPGFEIYYETDVEWEIEMLLNSKSVTPMEEFEVKLPILPFVVYFLTIVFFIVCPFIITLFSAIISCYQPGFSG